MAKYKNKYYLTFGTVWLRVCRCVYDFARRHDWQVALISERKASGES